jgi:DNA polymerase
MPQGRKIPRPPTTGPRRPAPPTDDVVFDPAVVKAAGELTALAAQILACEACGRAGPDRAYGTGHPRAPVMLVKEQPSAEDLESTNAFASDADPLTKAFDALGIPLSWLYGATAVRCGPAVATSDELVACSVHLLAEIEAVGPRVIVAFGPKAAEAIRALDGRCGITAPGDLTQGSTRIRPDLMLLVTEPLPEGLTNKEAKRRLWRDLQVVPSLLDAR